MKDKKDKQIVCDNHTGARDEVCENCQIKEVIKTTIEPK